MAVAALIISIVGLLVSVHHNRLSLRPYLVSRRLRDRKDDGMTFTYALVNVGLGPAKITSLELFVDGKRQKPAGELSPVDITVAECFGGRINYRLMSSSFPSEGYCLRPNEEYVLVKIFFPTITPPDEESFSRILRGVHIDVRYESFYGDRFVFTSREGGVPVI